MTLTTRSPRFDLPRLAQPFAKFRLTLGWRQSWDRFATFLAVTISGKKVERVSLRVLAPDQVLRSQIETVREVAEGLAPPGVPVKLYLLRRPHAPLFDLTCCLSSHECETVTFHAALLHRTDRRKELTRKIGELFSSSACKVAGK